MPKAKLLVGIKVGTRSLLGAIVSRAINRLTVRQVQAITTVGRHSDGGGLYLRVTPGGARSWVFMAALSGKRTEIGLGAASSVPLASARRLATQMREAIALGTEPRAVLVSPEPARAAATFGSFADEYIESVQDGWKNRTHRDQWRNSLRDHAGGLRNLALEDVGTDAVLAALRPIWLSKPETASRVRGRIEKILAAAKARGLRPQDAINPATWRGHLDVLLPKQSKLTRGHHAALPYGEAPQFMVELAARSAVSARCLEFTIFTAARSGEALGATWSEIDLEQRVWLVPADRMKAGADHIVPLSEGAMRVLEARAPSSHKQTEAIFSIGGARRSNMAMSMLLRRMGCGAITVHGFRSTFRDWAGDVSNFPREIIEQALAHTISNKAERAYRRGTAVERRRALMEAWSSFLIGSH
ncbi:tyrosine-type recombinase/integrase [Sphingomonas sp. Tas61C01]|uniref:tyrosine-type recombinase/integrase n=1 Tax=Sphingomonas sp. Tas61C01 TaxID=3458297 RepID=UPI00403EDDE2